MCNKERNVERDQFAGSTVIGHEAEFKAYAERIASGGEPLIPLEQSVNTTLASFVAMTSEREGRVVRLGEGEEMGRWEDEKMGRWW